MGLIKERIVAKLEQLPEVLKQTVLQNFQIEGTVPITRHEMQEMMRLSISDLKTTIEMSEIHGSGSCVAYGNVLSLVK